MNTDKADYQEVRKSISVFRTVCEFYKESSVKAIVLIVQGTVMRFVVIRDGVIMLESNTLIDAVSRYNAISPYSEKSESSIEVKV